MSDGWSPEDSEFWRDIVYRDDGTLDEEAVQRELHDFRLFMRCASEWIYELTDGVLSKPNTDPRWVIEYANAAGKQLQVVNVPW